MTNRPPDSDTTDIMIVVALDLLSSDATRVGLLVCDLGAGDDGCVEDAWHASPRG